MIYDIYEQCMGNPLDFIREVKVHELLLTWDS